MVLVNGNMVPPHGGVQDPKPQKISYTGGDGKPAGEIDKGDSLRAEDKDKGPVKKKYGEKKRYGRSRGLTVEKDPKKAGEGCSGTIYMHVHLSAAPECKPADIQAAKDKMDEAAKKWNGKCLCPPPKPGMRFKKDKKGNLLDGCGVNFALVWHDKPGADVITITIWCKWDPKDGLPGEARQGSGLGAGIRVVDPGKTAQSVGYYAHELGHMLFGTAEADVPNPDPKDPKKKWEGGHNPDPKGIMRDTQLKEPYGIADDEFPSQEEFCILAKKYELCAFDKKTGELVGCCVYEEGPPHEEEKDEGKEDRGKEGTKPVRHDGANSSSSNIRYPWKPPGASLPTGPRLFEKLPKHP